MPNAALPMLRSMLLISGLCLTISIGESSDAAAMGKVPDVPVVLSRCPPLKNYDPATTAKAAEELRALLGKDAGAATPGIVRDYPVLRDRRAIEGK